MTPQELFEELSERCAQVWVFDRRPDGSPDAAGSAVGAMLPTSDDGMLVVEPGVSSVDGSAFVTIRRFDSSGELVEPDITSLAGVTMITA